MKKGYDKKEVCRMQLFEQENFHVSRIVTVNRYKTELEFGAANIRHYPIYLYQYELVFSFSGYCITHFAGKTMIDCENSMRYMPKEMREGAYWVERKEDGMCVDIYFDTDLPMPQTALSFQNMNELRSSFEKIYHIWQSKKSGYYCESMAMFYDIIRRMQQHESPYISAEQAQRLAPAVEYLRAHYDRLQFDYTTLGRISGLSYNYFKELFIKQFGMAPVKYVTMLRIEKAKELLATGRYSVTEIAELCGYENVYYLSTIFKKQMGLSPTQYIR